MAYRLCIDFVPEIFHLDLCTINETFSIAEGMEYKKNTVLTPLWVGKWKDKSRDYAITVPKDINFNWVEEDWWDYFLLSYFPNYRWLLYARTSFPSKLYLVGEVRVL